MRLLVLGGSGFLSGTVVRVARDAGHDVTVVTRGRRPMPEGFQAIVADRDRPEAFADAIAGTPGRWDAVVDCIGFNAAHARQDLDCFAGRASHVVFVSTDFALDAADRPWRVDETFDRYERELPYGRGKREAEEVLLSGAADAAKLGTLVTILRPCHIYGPGSQLGCLPEHGRDPTLLDTIRSGGPLRLVGGGHFLQQPVNAADIAAMAISCVGNARVGGQLYLCAGPDVIASREYYRIVADAIGAAMPPVVEVPIDAFLATDPTKRPFCCHRVYSLEKARAHGLAVPATPLRDGLTAHVRSLVGAG